VLKAVAAMGTITVKFYFIKNIRQNAANQSPEPNLENLQSPRFDHIQENAMKGDVKSHQIVYVLCCTPEMALRVLTSSQSGAGSDFFRFSVQL
jgi:hypothetical protein